MKDLHSLNKVIDDLSLALDILQKNKKVLPDEYKFLLDPDFKSQLERAKGQAERILMSAQKVGETEGPENVDSTRIKEIVQYLQERNLLEGPEASEEEETDTGAKSPKDSDSKKPTKNSKENGTKVRAESKENPDEKVTKVKARAMKVIEQLLDLD